MAVAVAGWEGIEVVQLILGALESHQPVSAVKDAFLKMAPDKAGPAE